MQSIKPKLVGALCISFLLFSSCNNNVALEQADTYDNTSIDAEPDMINGFPFYVEYDFTYKESNHKSEKIINVSNPSEINSECIAIFSETTLYNFEIFSVIYDNISDFYFNETIFSLDELPSNHVVMYETTLPEGVPYEAISFTDANGAAYSYLLAYSGKDDSASAIEIDIKK